MGDLPIFSRPKPTNPTPDPAANPGGEKGVNPPGTLPGSPVNFGRPGGGPGGNPDVPGAPNVPSPDADDEETRKKTQAAMEAASAEQRKPRGRAATILTSGLGLEDAPKLSRRMLLGS